MLRFPKFHFCRKIYTCKFLIGLICFLSILFSISMGKAAASVGGELDTKIEKAMGRVDVANLKNALRHLESLGSRSSLGKQWEAATWIRSQFEKNGLQAWIEEYEFRGKSWPNVLAKVEGERKVNEVVMLIAHMDSISRHPDGIAPGADDDGTGVAVLLEIARICKEFGTERTLMFGIFSNEEVGNVGSRNYASYAKKHRMNIIAVVNFDILGYNRPEFPFFYLTAALAQGTWKHKAKSIIRMGQNFLFGILKGKDIVKVGGRELDRDLVITASLNIKGSEGLKVEELIQNDCA